ncbi:MAG: Na+/H+ antiporter subunit E [Coriobacteriia bacterium]|nr:Na+/H+ antiporter subunit E [Coriobacteriia bacterium]
MRLALRFTERLVAFAFVWWVLAEGEPSSWLFGVPFVVLASITSLRLTPARAWRLRAGGTLRFIVFFAHQSIVGGVDVALRALRPSMPISPGFVSYPVRLPTESARVLLADTVSLLPGTLSSGFEGDTLVMHVLDCNLPILDDVRQVESRISEALGLSLEPAAAAGRGGGARE